MYNVTIPQRINQIVAMFHVCGMWRQEDENVWRKMGRRLIYLVFLVSFVISMSLGGFLSDDKNECIFLVGLAVQLVIVTIKLIYILWKKEEIFAFLLEIGVHSVTNCGEFNRINEKINNFMKLATCFIYLVVAQFLFLVSLPLFSRETILPFNAAFPLDWKNSKIAYCMAYAYVATGSLISCIVVLLNIVIWYVMMNCSIKYETLGSQFKNMGSIITAKPTDKPKKVTEVEKQKLFENELIGLIKNHQDIQETIERFKSCFSDLFFAQITTSGICICASIYVLAFSSNENFIETAIYLVAIAYSLFDIFMVMYFGNEIKLSSGRLSYYLFESNWIGQSKASKKCIIILSEVLKQPHQLIIAKLYPLDLETFISILNLAYSMFNILKNFK